MFLWILCARDLGLLDLGGNRLEGEVVLFFFFFFFVDACREGVGLRMVRHLSHGLIVNGAVFPEHIDGSTITRLRAEAEDHCLLHVVFICFVPNTGTRLVVLGVLVAMHGRQDRTTPDHGISRWRCARGWIALF